MFLWTLFGWGRSRGRTLEDINCFLIPFDFWTNFFWFSLYDSSQALAVEWPLIFIHISSTIMFSSVVAVSSSQPRRMLLVNPFQWFVWWHKTIYIDTNFVYTCDYIVYCLCPEYYYFDCELIIKKSASDCVRINLRRSTTEKFSGGACPQTPLQGCGLKPTALTVTCAPPPLHFLDPPLLLVANYTSYRISW